MPKADKPAASKVALCACTCGEPISPKSTFRQGHDQRLIGLLAACIVGKEELTNELVARLQLPTEVEDYRVDIQLRIDLVTAAVRTTHSPALAAKFASAAGLAWHKAVKETPKTLEKVDRVITVDGDIVHSPAAQIASKIKNARQISGDAVKEAEKYAVVTGAPITVKVGRKKIDATIHGMSQAGKITAVRYETPGGHEMIKTEGQFTLIEE